MDAKKVPYVTHNDGTKMQSIGLGTYTSLGGECHKAVCDAIDAGYRHIDTAYFYENEREVGDAIREKCTEGIVERKDMFVVSKLWSHFHEPQRVEYACRKTLANFGFDYVDVYLMHWPYAYVYRGDSVMMPTDAEGQVEMSDIDYLDTWAAMEKLVDLGLTKSIGVSNFNVEQLERLLANARIKPIHNQIECHPALIPKKVIAFCREHNIIVSAYCPLGRPDPVRKTPKFIFDNAVKKLAKAHNKTPAQVALRYLYEIGVVPLPKSVNKKRIEENIQIFDFQLSSDDHKILETYNVGERLIPMDHASKSPYYPFTAAF